MAFDSYNDLVAEIAEELDRDDLSSTIPKWVARAETYLSKKVRLVDGEQTVTDNFVPSQDYIDLPAGFKRPIQFEIPVNSLVRQVNIVSWDKWSDVRSNISGNTYPLAAAYLGRRMYLAPTPKTANEYRLIYYGKPAPLATAGTNDLLEMGGDALYYTALVYSAPFLADDERLPVWINLRDDAVRDLKREYFNSHIDGGVDRIRPDFAPADRMR